MVVPMLLLGVRENEDDDDDDDDDYKRQPQEAFY
jgi:hypothetical protein